MKKINFKNLSSDEILTRDELKRIVGGNASEGNGGQACFTDCYCPEGSKPMQSTNNSVYGIGISCDGSCTTIEHEGVYCDDLSDRSVSCDYENNCVPTWLEG